MKKVSIVFISLVITLCFALTVSASPLFLEDWGVLPGTWTPTNAPTNLYWTTEDYTAQGPGFINPGWGGQTFDAEAAYIAFEGTKIYFAVVTGLPQWGGKDFWRYDNPSYRRYDWNQRLEKYWYDPGDLGIDIGGDGTYEFAVTTRPNNTNSSYAYTPGAGWLLSGNLLWENPKAWENSTSYTNWGGISNPWAVVGYDNAINLGVNFSYAPFGSDHYAIEAIIDNSILDLKNGELLATHWTMECGNDAINVSGPATVVPEPSTILLLSSGIAIITFYYNRKKFRFP